MSTPETHITRIGTILVPVGDQDRALRFFTETLGFETRIDGEFGGGERWIEVALPGAETTIALVDSQASEVSCERLDDRVGVLPAESSSLGRSTVTGWWPCLRSSGATRCQSHELPPPPWMSANVDTETELRRRLRPADDGRAGASATSACPALALMMSSTPSVPSQSAVSMNSV